MMPVYHVSISAILGLVFIVWIKSYTAAAACLFCGVLIDLDHHLDYFLAKHKIPWRYRDLVYFGSTDKRHKLYLWFHSYEGLLVLWGCIYYFNLNEVWVGAAVGLTVHLICDQIVNPLRPLTYFLVYRIYHRFSKEKLFCPKYFRTMKPWQNPVLKVKQSA